MAHSEVNDIQHQRKLLSELKETFSIDGEGDFDTALLLTNSAQQIEVREHFLKRSRRFKNPVLATLTYRNAPSRFEDIANLYEGFLNVLSKRCFKHAYRRYGKMVKRPLAICEMDADTRPHIHAIFDCPKKMNPLDFKLHIESSWKFGIAKFQPSYSDPVRGVNDWVDYMCKFRSKDTRNRPFADYVLI
jgi:hypothetical protein